MVQSSSPGRHRSIDLAECLPGGALLGLAGGGQGQGRAPAPGSPRTAECCAAPLPCWQPACTANPLCPKGWCLKKAAQSQLGDHSVKGVYVDALDQTWSCVDVLYTMTAECKVHHGIEAHEPVSPAVDDQTIAYCISSRQGWLMCLDLLVHLALCCMCGQCSH